MVQGITFVLVVHALTNGPNKAVLLENINKMSLKYQYSKMCSPQKTTARLSGWNT